ncbi:MULTISPECIES: hypothetical protein [Psychrobacillus]|nr:hypothetical protein [Psychrobacillus psychrotolerans]
MVSWNSGTLSWNFGLSSWNYRHASWKNVIQEKDVQSYTSKHEKRFTF